MRKETAFLVFDRLESKLGLKELSEDALNNQNNIQQKIHRNQSK